MSTHFMFDLETLDNKPTSVVLDAAFISFNIDEDSSFQDLIDDSRVFYRKLDVKSQIAMGRTMGKDTVEWWEKQSDEAKSILKPSDEDVTLETLVRDLEQWCQEQGIDTWSHGYCRGPSFDFSIMSNLVEQVAPGKYSYSMFPTAFWNQKCVRTAIGGMVCDMKKTKFPLPKGSLDGFIHHNSVHDCARAIMQLQYALRASKGEIELDYEADPLSFK